MANKANSKIINDYFTPIKLNEVVINTEPYLWTAEEQIIVRERRKRAQQKIKKIKEDGFIIYNMKKFNLSEHDINSVLLFMLYNGINLNIDPPLKIFNILKLFYGKSGKACRFFNKFYYRHFKHYKIIYKFNYNNFVPNVIRVDYFYEAFKSYFGIFFK